MQPFLGSVRSEWLKVQHSLTGWFLLGAAAFVPVIMLAVRFKYRSVLASQLASGTFWALHWKQSWEAMTIMVLPVAVVLVTALIVQIEWRSNAWKQLHVSPQSLTTIYLAKLLVVLGAVAWLVALQTLGFVLSGLVPALTVDDAHPLQYDFPVAMIAARSGRFLLECLPIVGLQYLLSVRFKNFLVPVGVGLGVWILSLVLFNSNLAAFAGYVYAGLDFAMTTGQRRPDSLPSSLPLVAIAQFVVLVIAGLAVYRRDEARG